MSKFRKGSIVFGNSLSLNFLEVGNEGLSSESCKDSSQNIQEVERN